MRYAIQGGTLPVVVCELEAGESMITEGGAMSWMSPNMQMRTSGGGFGKAFGRMLSGENVFQNIYTAQGGPGMIAFASSFPGSIRAFPVTPEEPLIFQKRSFLASEDSVSFSVHFRKRLGTGLFGGEGFIMQKISGHGLMFAEFDGHVVEYALEAGQSILIDTGHLAAMSASCQMSIEKVPGIKNVLFGGEGLFHTRVTGPGKVWLQTMPVGNLAQVLIPYLPSNTNVNFDTNKNNK